MVDWNKELIKASGDGNLERMEEAIGNEADVNFKDKIGKTPLFYASLFVRKKAIELLLENGAGVDLEIKDSEGKSLTVFLWAVRNDYRGMVEFLLEKGADFSAMDKTNQTALEYTLNNKKDNKTEVLKILIKHTGVNVNRKSRDGKTLMMHVMEGNVKDEKEKKTKINVVRMLIRKGAEVDATDGKSETNLIYAIKGGHLKIAEILILNGADVNAKDSDDKTALALAVEKGYTSVVEALIRNGASVNTKDANGKTALTLATDGKYEKIVELLIQKGVDVNIILNGLKEKVLMWSAREGHKKITELAIEKGLCVKLKNICGETALIVAAKNGHTEIVELLINEGAYVNNKNNVEETALAEASANGHTKTAELLIQKGADVNTRNGDGLTPLMWTALNKHTETAELLIQKGADVNAKAWDKRSALMYAGLYNRAGIIKLFIEKGADVVDALRYALEKGNIVMGDNIAKVLRENPNLNKIEYRMLYRGFDEIEKYEKTEFLAALRKLTKEKVIGKGKALEIFREVNKNWNNKMENFQRINMRLPKDNPNRRKMRRIDRMI